MRGGVTALIRINTSKSSQSPRVFCGRSQGAWIDKTHLHCSEMADWSDLKRKIPFTSLQYNLLSHILAEKGGKKENNQLALRASVELTDKLQRRRSCFSPYSSAAKESLESLEFLLKKKKEKMGGGGEEV